MEKEENGKLYSLDCALRTLGDLKKIRDMVVTDSVPISIESVSAIDSLIKELTKALYENVELFLCATVCH